jgi:hypothetical protein
MTKAIEQALALVPVTKPKTLNPVVQRRTRLLKSIRRQQALVQSYKAGEKTQRHSRLARTSSYHYAHHLSRGWAEMRMSVRIVTTSDVAIAVHHGFAKPSF